MDGFVRDELLFEKLRQQFRRRSAAKAPRRGDYSPEAAIIKKRASVLDEERSDEAREAGDYAPKGVSINPARPTVQPPMPPSPWHFFL